MTQPRIILETPRLRLRTWTEPDRARFATLNADPQVMEFYPSTYTREESSIQFDKMLDHWSLHGFGFCVMEVPGSDTPEFAGMVGLKWVSIEAHFTPAVEIGYRVLPQYWNQGLTTEAGHALLDYGFKALQLPEIVAYTFEGNHRSRRVMEKLGMEHAGEFAHPWLDADHWLQKHVLYRIQR